ncbi:putative thioesterase [Nocardiopsis mwathae]|uniref:Putative thioesterase n=1 Tax=Nocardiopsis mwathae TaxID=1472723 RepID=A0A7W9YJA5_9ACTN|nr:hotdog domain-containing protein [Nocardiopsis mwathae]MBB6173213.1 putative thioesterase [Nocardiopsis mwathae]
MTISEGLRGTAVLAVSDNDTAIALRSGDVPVLGTPRVLALAEEATVDALSGHLDEGQTSVGTNVALSHTAPTAVGTQVQATALLVAVDGKRLVFDVTVVRDVHPIAKGTVSRAIVNRERFLAAVQEQRPDVTN